MVFAFLPTALLFFVAMFFFGAAIALLFMGNLIGALLGLGAMLASLIAETLAIKGSHKLYIASMATLPLGYDKWLKKQQSIASRSFGMKRLYVFSNILMGALAYEQLDDALEALEMLRPCAEKKKNPYVRYNYYSGLLSVREKMQELSSADYLLEQMYETLNSPKFPQGGVKASYVTHFEYTQAAIEFYKRTPRQLSTTDRNVAEKLIAVSRINASVSNKLSQIIGYRALSCYYNIGLSLEVIGEHQQAGEYFDRIVNSGCLYPLVDRVRLFLSSNDLSILFSKMP